MRVPQMSLKVVACVAFAPVGLAFVLGLGWLALRSCNGEPIEVGIGVGVHKGEPAVRELQLSGTTRVELGAPGTLTITLGEPEMLRIDASPKALAHLRTEVDGNRLVIRAHGHLRESPQYRVTIKRLDGLKLAGSGDVVAPELKGEEIEVALAGSGDVQTGPIEGKRVRLNLASSGEAKFAGVRAGSLDLTTAGSANVRIGGGEVQEQRIVVNGSGEVDARQLQSTRVTTTINGSGAISVWARESLRATINGSGRVGYRGRPAIEQRIHGSGAVEPLGD